MKYREFLEFMKKNSGNKNLYYGAKKSLRRLADQRKKAQQSEKTEQEDI